MRFDLEACNGFDATTLLQALFRAGIEAVSGDSSVRRELQVMDLEPQGIGDKVRLLAFGKAADAMASGAIDVLGNRLRRGLVVTKHGHLSDGIRQHPQLCTIESSHPVPDESSLAAGEAVLAEVASVQSDEHLLILVSGGGSSLLEALVEGIDLDQLRARTAALLARGAAIDEINRERRLMSRIKGGKLLKNITAGRVTQLLISDVPGDRINDIASGPLVSCEGISADTTAVESRLVATNQMARRAVIDAANAHGLVALDGGCLLNVDVYTAASRLEKMMTDMPSIDVLVAGGEPTVVLPSSPGQGGRNQQLAALMAGRLAASQSDAAVTGCSGTSIHWMVCGTDGTDGPTDAAGGLVSAATVKRAAMHGHDLDNALAQANTGPWLESADALVRTGPTGTNVMDLAIGLRVSG